jgi:predicted ester cyclase
LSEDSRPSQGFDQFKRFRQGILSAFPDMRVRVEDVLVDGEKSAVRLSFFGTHTGDGIGVPPTHRRFVASAIVIIRWQDGKIIEAWNEFDAAGMMRQLQAPGVTLRAKVA